MAGPDGLHIIHPGLMLAITQHQGAREFLTVSKSQELSDCDSDMPKVTEYLDGRCRKIVLERSFSDHRYRGRAAYQVSYEVFTRCPGGRDHECAGGA